MLTKNEIADLAIEINAGGVPPDSKRFHRKVYLKAVDTVLSESIAKLIARKQRDGDQTVESTWVQPFDKVPIKYDLNRKQCYVAFPARVISLEQNKGLREIGWRDASVAQPSFQIIDGLAQNVLSNLECSILPEGVFYAAIEGDRIYFPSMNYTYAERKAAVRVKMLCGADGFDSTTPLPIPDELAATVVQMVAKMMEKQATVKQKTINDSNSNTV